MQLDQLRLFRGGNILAFPLFPGSKKTICFRQNPNIELSFVKKSQRERYIFISLRSKQFFFVCPCVFAPRGGDWQKLGINRNKSIIVGNFNFSGNQLVVRLASDVAQGQQRGISDMLVT